MVRNVRKFLTSFKMQVKRRFLMLAKKELVKDELKKRRGECLSCGECCKASFACPFLYQYEGKLLCQIHETKPEVCKIYPFNEQDMFPHTRERCGYYFVCEEGKKDGDDSEEK